MRALARRGNVGRAMTTKWTAKAKEIAASLRAQHAAGLAGDDSPAEPVWPTPKQQLDAVKHLFRSKSVGSTTPVNDVQVDNRSLDRDAEQVAEQLRGVNWVEVRATTAERTSEMARTMKSLADHVDWAKVQPLAAQVSSALIAAVAAGRIPVGGPLGPIVVRAITDQNNLGKRVAESIQRNPAGVPNDMRQVIEATATET